MVVEPNGQEEIIYVRPHGRGVIFPLSGRIEFDEKYGEGYFKIKIISYITDEEFKKIKEHE